MKLIYFCLIILCTGACQSDITTPLEEIKADNTAVNFFLQLENNTKNRALNSRDASVDIENGIVFIVQNQEGKLKYIDKVEFNKEEVNTEGVLLVKTSIPFGKYLLFVIVNPLPEMRKALNEKLESPEKKIWETLASYSFENHEGIEQVLTNITEYYPEIGKGGYENDIRIEEGQNHDKLYVRLKLTRIIAKISMEDGPIEFADCFVNEIDNTNGNFKYLGYTLLNLPQQIYLWQHWDTVGSKENWMAVSPYQGDYNEEKYTKSLSSLVKIHTNGRIDFLNYLASHTNDQFNFTTQYFPENIAISCDQNGNYLARLWETTAIVLAVKDLNTFPAKLFYSYTNNQTEKTHFVKYSAGLRDYISYPGAMYLTFFIKDPNQKAVIDGAKQNYPSIYRNTHYKIKLPKIARTPVDRPGRDLPNVLDKNYNILQFKNNSTSRAFRDSLPDEYFIELEEIPF